MIVFDAAGVTSSRCTCSARMRPNDFCRHLAVLVERMVGEGRAAALGEVRAERVRAIAFTRSSEGASPRAGRRSARADAAALCPQRAGTGAARSRLGSARLLFEASPLVPLEQAIFCVAQTGAAGVRDADIALALHEERIALPPAAVEHVISAAPEDRDVQRFRDRAAVARPVAAHRDHAQSALRFTPVLLVVAARCSTARRSRSSGSTSWPATASRARPRRRCSWNRDRPQRASSRFAPAPGLRTTRDRDRRERCLRVSERHRRELASLPEELAPEAVRNARPVRLDGEVTFDFAAPVVGLRGIFSMV